VSLNRVGAKNLGVSKVVPLVVKLLDDQSIPVRNISLAILFPVYIYVSKFTPTSLHCYDQFTPFRNISCYFITSIYIYD